MTETNQQANLISSSFQNHSSNTPSNPQNDEKNHDKGYLFNVFDISAFAVTIVIGGQYYNFNTFFQFGFGYFAIAQVMMAVAYIIYVLCIAEIVSAFPFSGGGYGLARVVQGFYVGFLVGIFESLEYIIYTALSALYIAQQLCGLM